MEGSESLPLVVTGDADCLRSGFGFTGPDASTFLLAARPVPGLDLPAETGRSGIVVRRFGGVSRGKSGGTMG